MRDAGNTPDLNALFGLGGKRILVLGGGQGIGEATSTRLAALGAHVAVVDREIERARRVSDAIATAGGTAMPFTFDVLDDAGLIGGIADVERELGPIDGMATIIGMAAWARLVDLELDVWDDEHRRNLRYFFVAGRQVARGLLARGAPGAIVGVSSVDGLRCAPFHGAYGAAKAGLSNLVKTMAVEWSPSGIRANIVAPGAIITPRIPHAGENEARMMTRVPMQRRGNVEEIANAIVFMLSDMASYVSGQTLAVDGGMLAAYPIDMVAPAKPQGALGTVDA